MDVELQPQPSQAQHAGRGDRVARTREAIVASTLTLTFHGTRYSTDSLRGST
jgi:hypothetical protein